MDITDNKILIQVNNMRSFLSDVVLPQETEKAQPFAEPTGGH